MSFISQNKILPGVYANFTASGLHAFTPGQRGRVAVFGVFSWGAPKKVLEVEDVTLTAKMGYAMEDSAMLPLKLLFQNATKAFVYRLNEGVQASAQLVSGLTAKAKWGGSRGNDLSVAVKADGELFEITTYLAGKAVDAQMVASAGDFQENGWITLEGSGSLGEASVTLTGGTDGENPEAADYEAALAAYELCDFDVIVYCGEDTGVKAKLIPWVKTRRQNEQFIQCVVVDEKADHEGVLSLRQGFVDEDGVEIPARMAACWLAGAAAGAKMTESNTYKVVSGMKDVRPRYTRLMQETAVLDGQCVFDVDADGVRLVYDINTLTTYNSEKPQSLRKNKILRVIDTSARDVADILKKEFLGKVANSEEGRSRVKGRLAEYFSTLQDQGSIENFEAASDVEVLKGADSDAIVVNYAISPVDTGDKFYLTAEVR